VWGKWKNISARQQGERATHPTIAQPHPKTVDVGIGAKRITISLGTSPSLASIRPCSHPNFTQPHFRGFGAKVIVALGSLSRKMF
jgi:hypothetical protein